MISLGLVVGARVRSEELAGGLLNLITWPMMFVSGVWFSLEGMNPTFQAAANAFPLTHLLDGARAVMLDGAGFGGILPQLAWLTGMSVVFLVTSALLFRWQDD